MYLKNSHLPYKLFKHLRHKHSHDGYWNKNHISLDTIYTALFTN